ncbi:MAG TPA: acetyl xylan esterase, partial [Isosphaeraceae bacterium]|nr:acetyl xylan esterase [Isosphaeraceae bacterium]
EGAQSAENPEDLFAFNEKHPRPPWLKTSAQLETELVGIMGRQIDKLAPESTSAAWEAARAFLLASLKVRVGLVNPASEEVASQLVRATSQSALNVKHYLVGRRTSGEQIPTVCFRPEHATGHATLLFTPNGKANLVKEDGQPTALVQALLDRGETVIGFDPLLVGESIDPSTPAHRRPDTYVFDCYNPTLAADRAQDLATVIAWARAQPDLLFVSLVAEGSCGPLALLARPALEGLARTAIDLNGFDYADGSADVPPALDLPGVLQFGGPKVAAALTCPAPLWIYHAPDSFDTKWPVKAYARADQPGLLRIDSQEPEPAALAGWIVSGETTR